MNKIVKFTNSDIFTDSMVIANGTNNQHNSVTRILRNYEDDFRELGKIKFMDLKSKNPTGGRPTKIYVLNEQQATLLITYLNNTEAVRKFKKELVKEFYRMRLALMERQTTDWLQTRQKGKLVRRKETDALAQLKIYAEEQREGKPYKHIYTNYTKLVNSAVGLGAGERNIATFKQLQMVALLEDMIENTVLEEMENSVFFKEIYNKCKKKVDTFVSLMYLDINVRKLNSAS
jgi:phage regulator Rha-like protein